MRTRTMHNEWIRLITAGGLLGLAAIAPTEGWVTGLSKQEIGSGVQLKIEGKDLSQPRELRVLNGTAYIVEFDAQLQGGVKTLHIDSAGVSSARFATSATSSASVGSGLKPAAINRRGRSGGRSYE